MEVSDEPPKGFQSVKEHGTTFLRHSGTGEIMQMPPRWPDEVRARQVARIKAARVKTQKANEDTRTKQSSRVSAPKLAGWRRCDAMKDGKVCRKWQKLHKTEFNNLDLPYRCRTCAKANRDTDPDFKPIGPDWE